MKGKFVFLVFLAVFLMGPLLSGCTKQLGGMTAISTRNVTLNKVDLDKMPQVKNIKGKDSRYSFLSIPLGIPTVQGAVDDALTQGNGDLIIDGVIHAEAWSLFLLGQNTISVTGTVVNTRGGQQ